MRPARARVGMAGRCSRRSETIRKLTSKKAVGEGGIDPSTNDEYRLRGKSKR
jgi:hypothetical protein